jgi:thioredoxin-like negative regulator of GroEL
VSLIHHEPLSDLIFVYMPGCEACEEAEPELETFVKAHPRMMVLRVRADGPFPAQLGLKKIKATPTYVYRRGRDATMFEGGLTAKQIEKWIGEINSPSEEE